MSAFIEFADGGAHMTAYHLRRFLADCQRGCVEADDAERSTEQIRQLRHWNPLGKIPRRLLSLEDFHHIIFSVELNHPLISQMLMDDMKVSSLDAKFSKRQGHRTTVIPVLDFLVKIPERLHSSLKSHFMHLAKNDLKISSMKPMKITKKELCSLWELNLDKQLQAWKENPNWVDQPA